jgi:hypothetical protein
MVGCCKTAALAAALIAIGATSAAAARNTVKPCEAGQATKGCTRTWVAPGCNQFVPLVTAALHVGSATATRYRGRVGPLDLSCGFAIPGNDTTLTLLFAHTGATTTTFANIKLAYQHGVTGCVATEAADPATQGAAATPNALPKLGDQAFVYDPCPGGGFVVNQDQVLTSTPAVYVRRGATAYNSTWPNASQLEVFVKSVVAKYR